MEQQQPLVPPTPRKTFDDRVLTKEEKLAIYRRVLAHTYVSSRRAPQKERIIFHAKAEDGGIPKDAPYVIDKTGVMWNNNGDLPRFAELVVPFYGEPNTAPMTVFERNLEIRMRGCRSESEEREEKARIYAEMTKLAGPSGQGASGEVPMAAAPLPPAIPVVKQTMSTDDLEQLEAARLAAAATNSFRVGGH